MLLYSHEERNQEMHFLLMLKHRQKSYLFIQNVAEKTYSERYNLCQKSWNNYTVFKLIKKDSPLPSKQFWFIQVLQAEYKSFWLQIAIWEVNLYFNIVLRGRGF